jgi:uncharacterized membrane protein
MPASGVGRRGAARYIQPMREPENIAEALLFEALIVPHRSLSPRGLRILLAVIAGLCGLTALRFWLLGAWPVIGFAVAEVGLAIWLIRLNAHSARASELLLLSPDALRIVRTDARGRRREQTLSPAWLNVVMQEKPGRVPTLLLTTRHVREEVAAMLGEAEKRDLAAALAEALHRWRHPVFDNSQLRDEGN